MNEKDKIIWQSYEFDYKEKSTDWFWAISIITLCIGAIAFIYEDPLFAIFMVIAGITIFITARKKPRVVNFEINTKGIKIDDTLYPYGNLRSFWVEDNKFAPPRLLLKSEKFITPIFVIPIETNVEDASDLRAFLLSFLPEEKLHEPLSHKFVEFLGF